MADGAARYQRQSLEDTVMAFVDKMLYEAIFGGFYGELTFSFKAGKIVLVRRVETVLPTHGLTDGGENIVKDNDAHQRCGTVDH